MPEISVGAQIFDVVFHPHRPIVYTGLLTGHIKSYSYNDQGAATPIFSVRPSKRSCRGLSLNAEGSKLYAVGKAKTLNVIDVETQAIDTRGGAHDVAINCVKSVMPWMVATGDDDGTVKLWDPRQKEATKTYTQHFDYISDFLWLQDKKHLVCTSGDGSLSVIDIRAKKPEPVAQSEDQEDELLSIVAIKGQTKALVGTQIGIISVFNRNKGWGDCVDRIPGHPMSVDALCNIPSIPGVDHDSTVLTGSSDGFVRAVQILPTKLIGVVADHGDFPIERIAVGQGAGNAEGEASAPTPNESKVKPSKDADSDSEMEENLSRPKSYWVGSVGHDDTLRMTDLEGFFREAKEDAKAALKANCGDDSDSDVDEDEDSDVDDDASDDEGKLAVEDEDDSVDWSDEEEADDTPVEVVPPQNQKRKRQPGPLPKPKKGKTEGDGDTKGFFDDL